MAEHKITKYYLKFKCYVFIALKAVNTMLYYHVSSVTIMLQWEVMG